MLTLPSNRVMNLSAFNQARFFPCGCSSIHWKKSHWRLVYLKKSRPRFFLNGTWSWWVHCCRVGSRSRGVDVGQNLSILVLAGHHSRQSNLEWVTCSCPYDPTVCRCPLPLKLLQGEQDKDKGWVCLVVKDSCRVVLLLVSAWRGYLRRHLDRICLECLWRRRRNRRLVTIFSLQCISYVFEH